MLITHFLLTLLAQLFPFVFLQNICCFPVKQDPKMSRVTDSFIYFQKPLVCLSCQYNS